MKEMGRNMLKEYRYVDDFRHLLTMQEEFGSKFCDFEVNRRENERGVITNWSKVFIDCIDDELSEVINWLPWKHWKNYSDFEIKKTEIRFVLIDILHFVLSLNLLQSKDDIEYPIYIFSPIQPEVTVRMIDNELYRIRAMNPTMVSHQIASTIEIVREVRHVQMTNMIELLSFYWDNLFKLFAIWGMTGADIMNYYYSKHAENVDRQERGY